MYPHTLTKDIKPAFKTQLFFWGLEAGLTYTAHTGQAGTSSGSEHVKREDTPFVPIHYELQQ